MKHTAFSHIPYRLYRTIFVIFLTLGASLSSYAQFYYGTTQTFGKERPVYNRFEWNYMRFPSYDIFYYKNGVNNARYIASILPEEIKKIDEYFGGTIETRMQIMCYNSLTDLKQSNILGSSEEKYDLSGITQAMGNKIFIYGTGVHEELRRQLRAGLMEVYLNYMVGGGAKNGETIRDIGLAEWFTLGLTAYYGTPEVTPEMLEVIKDRRSTGRFKNMKMYDNANAATLGYSIWYYLHNRYGAPTAARIVTRSIMDESERNGIQNTLGIPLKQVNRDWAQYFSQIFADDAFAYTGKKKKMPSIPSDSLLAKTKYHQRIDNFTVDKTGRYMAYAVGEDGIYSVFVKDLSSGKKKKLLSGGYRIPQNRDASIPILSFTGKKEQLAVVSEEKGDVFLRIYDISKHKKTEYRLSQVDKVLSLDFAPDGTMCVLSAVKNGYSDLYLYNTKSGALRSLTNDSYDDLSPHFYPSGQSILFSSTRVDDTLRNTARHSVATSYTDLFVYDMKKGNAPLRRLSSTSGVNEGQGVPVNESTALYTDDYNTHLRLNAVKTDSTVSHIDTTVHYRSVVTHLAINQPNKKLLSHDVSSYLTYYKNKYSLLPLDTVSGVKNAYFPKEKHVEGYRSRLKTPFPVDIYNYRFESQTNNKYSSSPIALSQDPYTEEKMPVGDTTISVKNLDASYYEKFKRLYRRTYFSTDVNAVLTNAYQNIDYEPFTGGPVSPPSAFGGGVTLQISDKMQDYSFIIGIGTDFSPLSGYSAFANSEYVVGFRNDKNRLKYGVTYYRRSMVQDNYNNYLAYITNLYRAHITYPLTPVSMFNVAVGLRRDKYRYLSTNEEFLAKEDTRRDYITLNASYTYDNSTYIDKNLRRGFRIKVFGEIYQGLYGNPQGQTMINIGVDARHYFRVHKNIIWANRIAFGSSVGNLKLLYYLGGVDNQFAPTFSTENPASQKYNWGFQTIATPMRGFPQNARYGNSFAVLNTELRFPLFQYLSRNTIRFAPLRHFQIVPFADMGAAWTSTTPWAADNEYNKKTLTQGDITIILNRSLDPFIFGYGVGLRTYFFGYFIRADWAWGHDSGLRVPMRFYLAMGFDF